MDCVLETKDYVYIFEFKLDGTAAEALQQIEDKGYATPYQTDTRKVTAIGVSFSSETMTVEEWEEKLVAQLRLNNSAKVMPQAGIITIPLEAVFIYGIGDINRLRFKIACYFLYPYTARLPNSSSMRSNWLYFAIRSLRLSEPVLICPLLVATAISAMVASSVSPERWLVTVV